MRAILQRVCQASVMVEGKLISQIDKGFLLLLGISSSDQSKDIITLTRKIISLRVFTDAIGKMNLNITDINGSILVVSQFTLFADCKKGNRPSFSQAAKPDIAKMLYEQFIEILKSEGIPTQSGEFGASMQVSLINDGPVTITLDSENL